MIAPNRFVLTVVLEKEYVLVHHSLNVCVNLDYLVLIVQNVCVEMIALVTENVYNLKIKQYVNVMRIGKEMIVVRNVVWMTVVIMENVQMESVTVIADLKENLANLKIVKMTAVEMDFVLKVCVLARKALWEM